MDDLLNVTRLIAEIRKLGKEVGVKPQYIKSFEILYHFYSETNSPEDDERSFQSPTTEKQRDGESGRLHPPPDFIQAYFEEVASVRERYEHRLDYYFLLKSFYNAFIFPIEQNISIANSCKRLEIDAIEFEEGKGIARLELEAFRSDEMAQQMAIMRNAFAAIGRICFGPQFNMSDFSNESTNRNQ